MPSKKDNFLLESVGKNIYVPEHSDAYTRSGYLPFGKDDKLPQLIKTLYREESVIHACVDTLCSFLPFNRDLTLSFLLYGAVPLLWNEDHWTILDHRWLRLNHDRTRFRYNLPSTGTYETFTDYASGGNIMYLALSDETPYAVTSSPVYTALISSMTLRSATESLFCDVSDGFRPTTLVSFNNGTPSSESQKEISNLIKEKFQATNGERVVISFSQDKEHAPDITSVPHEGYGEKYDTAIKVARNNIFSAFRLTPAICGVTDDVHTGFAENEYNAQFELFTRLTAKPLIDKISALLHVAPDYSLLTPLSTTKE